MTLNEWMLKRDIVDSDIADAVGLTRPYITRIRNGEVHPSLATALAIWNYTKRKIQIEELLPKHMRPGFTPAEPRARSPNKKRKPAAASASREPASV